MIDWESQTAETVGNLSRLIQAETINPPGNELSAILVIKDILEKEGFSPEEYTILEPATGRANLVIRLRGDGSARPLLLSGHVDVVPVEREHWSHDPFGGQVIDGAVWGRGALDMKGFLAMYLQIFLLARREGLPLKRDLILAAIADEENGFTYGSRFLVDQCSELIDAEYALNEGGAMTVHLGGARLYPIQVAEKGVCWMRMIADGTPGHGSIPHDDNAVLHLARALDRLGSAGHLPFHITPTVKMMLDAIGDQVRFPYGVLLGLLGSPTLAGLIVNYLPTSAKGLFTAIMSNSVSPTVLKAGDKTNVIPCVAEAHIDCRLLPGQTPADAQREIFAITGDGVKLEVINATTGTAFPTETSLYRFLNETTREMDPGGVVFPMIATGATDAVEYQRAGMIVYGFTPGVLPVDYPLIKLAHGHDERYPISAIRSGLPALWRVASEFCCRSSAA
jgi:acetylornithine deacetylase/succinyl-diaminopimelate desuccinylase-like protein